MNKIQILIVEDEIMIAEDIALRLSEMGYSISNTIDNVAEANLWLESHPVDLVLIDISLQGDKTGIDLAQIINKNFQLPFIFLSSLANQNIVSQIKNVNPAAYLLKPFNDRQVKVSIELALANFSGSEELPNPQTTENIAPENLLKMPNCLFLKKGTHYQKVAYENILWLEAESNYTVIHTCYGNFTYSTVLKNFEKKLPKEQFIRVHRSYIINITNITGFEGNTILMADKQIPINKSKRDDLFKRFEII